MYVSCVQNTVEILRMWSCYFQTVFYKDTFPLRQWAEDIWKRSYKLTVFRILYLFYNAASSFFFHQMRITDNNMSITAVASYLLVVHAVSMQHLFQIFSGYLSQVVCYSAPPLVLMLLWSIASLNNSLATKRLLRRRTTRMLGNVVFLIFPKTQMCNCSLLLFNFPMSYKI